MWSHYLKMRRGSLAGAALAVCSLMPVEEYSSSSSADSDSGGEQGVVQGEFQDPTAEGEGVQGAGINSRSTTPRINLATLAQLLRVSDSAPVSCC